MVHEGQRLPLGLEPGDDLRAIHARLEDFEGHLAADGLLLRGHEDGAEAALADLLQELVVADDRTGALADRLVGGGDRIGGWPVALQEIPRRLMRPEQLLDPGPPAGIPGACLIEKGGSLFR